MLCNEDLQLKHIPLSITIAIQNTGSASQVIAYPGNAFQLHDIPMRYTKGFRQEGIPETENYSSLKMDQIPPVIVI